MGRSRNWVVQTTQHVYLINVCRTLNKQEVKTNNGTVKECVAGDEVRGRLGDAGTGEELQEQLQGERWGGGDAALPVVALFR